MAHLIDPAALPLPDPRQWRRTRLAPNPGSVSGMGFVSRGTAEERLFEKILVGLPWECWPWYGGQSYGANRRRRDGEPIVYGIMREGVEDGGKSHRVWRPHVLMLLLKGPNTLKDCPRDDDEPLFLWLNRARRYYTQFLGMQVSHQCDLSLCCNPRHLEWESQEDHQAWAKDRRERLAQEPDWLPYCCEPQPEDLAVPGLVPADWRDRIRVIKAREVARAAERAALRRAAKAPGEEIGQSEGEEGLCEAP